mgnify:CR=1 FL=1
MDVSLLHSPGPIHVFVPIALDVPSHHHIWYAFTAATTDWTARVRRRKFPYEVLKVDVVDALSGGQWRSDPDNIVHTVFFRLQLAASPACQVLTKMGCSVWACFPFLFHSEDACTWKSKYHRFGWALNFYLFPSSILSPSAWLSSVRKKHSATLWWKGVCRVRFAGCNTRRSLCWVYLVVGEKNWFPIVRS